jgi:peptidoglycan/LPS O-acetylase OafA/YrhL
MSSTNPAHVCDTGSRKAPPLGRALRILIGLALIAYVTPVFFRVPLQFTVKVFLLLLGLIALFSFLHIASQRIVAFGSSLGAVVATGLLVALYAAGSHGSLIFGHGEGALAVITFRCFIGGCRCPRRSGLRSLGDSKSAFSEAH